MTEKSSTELTEEIKARVRRNLEEIFSAVAGKNVTVMAATKTVPAEMINYATQECGLHNIGENRVQELLSKFDALDKTGVNMHFIGTLQPNKVKYIVGKVCLIHSLDSMKLAEEISKRSAASGIVTDVLCEVNIGNEPAKSGVPEETAESFIESISSLPGINPRGIMVIGPHCGDPEDYRPFFGRTRALYTRLSDRGLFGSDPILSMGMSDNYRLAVEYGANLIRPGTAVFGRRG